MKQKELIDKIVEMFEELGTNELEGNTYFTKEQHFLAILENVKRKVMGE